MNCYIEACRSLCTGSRSDALTFNISNTGGEPLHFHLLADRAWPDARPIVGTVGAKASQAVSVRISDAGASAGDSAATMRVVSSGGTATLPVSIPFRLDGMYRGAFSVAKTPSSLGSFPISLALREDDNGMVQGTVEAARAPTFGLQVAVQGTRNPDGSYALSMELPGPALSPSNPDFPADIDRKISISLNPNGPRTLTGTYQEDITGPLTKPIAIDANISLRRASDYQSLTSETAAISLLPPPPPSWFDDCSICPGNQPCAKATGAVMRDPRDPAVATVA